VGLDELFEPGEADFSGIFLGESKGFITGFEHKTFPDVNEKGTEAAAISSMMEGAALKPPPPFRMIVDRPFFLAIRDTLSGLLLFTASVQDP